LWSDAWQAPVLLEQGTLYDSETMDKYWLGVDHAWEWPYIIISFVNGEPFETIFPALSTENKIKCAIELGSRIRDIHQHVPLGGLYFADSWTEFKRFIAKQRRNCVKLHYKWKYLNEVALSQLDSYLPKDITTFLRGSQLRFLHGDIADVNLLGTFVEEEARSPRGAGTESSAPQNKKTHSPKIWKPTAIVDFGDARVGDPIYDIVALHISVFRCDSVLLHYFLQSYGWEFGGWDMFAYKAMCYTLMHKEDAIRTVNSFHPEWQTITSITELTNAIWKKCNP